MLNRWVSWECFIGNLIASFARVLTGKWCTNYQSECFKDAKEIASNYLPTLTGESRGLFSGQHARDDVKMSSGGTQRLNTASLKRVRAAETV